MRNFGGGKSYFGGGSTKTRQPAKVKAEPKQKTVKKYHTNMTKPPAPSEHARLSPSSASRWMACPASLAMGESMPHKKSSSFFSDEGTAAHELAALILTNQAPVGYQDGYEATNGIFLTDQNIEYVDEYVRDVREYADGHEMLIETRIDYSHVIDVPDSFGTADVIILTADGEELQLHDLKFGRGVKVSAVKNKQLMTYALGALERFDIAGLVTRIRLGIHQPRISGISEWSLTRAELEEFGEDLKRGAQKAIAIADSGRPPEPNDFRVGDDQCRFCTAAAICPALGKHATELVVDGFVDLDAVEADTLKVQIIDGTRKLTSETNDTISALLKNVDLIEGWCKAIRQHATDEMMVGRKIPGFKLVQGKQGDRAWVDKKLAEKAIKGMRILKKHEMYKLALISPTVAEKLLKKGNPRRWNSLQSLIDRSEGGIHVAPEDDPRDAIVITPVVDSFADLDGDVEDFI